MSTPAPAGWSEHQNKTSTPRSALLSRVLPLHPQSCLQRRLPSYFIAHTPASTIRNPPGKQSRAARNRLIAGIRTRCVARSSHIAVTHHHSSRKFLLHLSLPQLGKRVGHSLLPRFTTPTENGPASETCLFSCLTAFTLPAIRQRKLLDTHTDISSHSRLTL